MTDPAVLLQVDTLQSKYLAALDRHDMKAWLACFADEASYSCITRENLDGNLPVALMLDDSHARLKDRVRFITEVWSGTFEDYSTRHFIQRFECDQIAPGRVHALSNFMVSFTNRRGGSEILVTGTYDDIIDVGVNGARFSSKKAILDTVTTPRYLVYPV